MKCTTKLPMIVITEVTVCQQKIPFRTDLEKRARCILLPGNRRDWHRIKTEVPEWPQLLQNTHQHLLLEPKSFRITIFRGVIN